MKKSEYFKYAIKNKLYSKMKWVLSLFAMPADKYKEDEFIKIIDGKYALKVDNDLIKTNVPITQPYLEMGTGIDMSDSEELSALGKTTIGISLANMILIKDIFGDKIKLVNGAPNIKDIEKQIVILKKDGLIDITSDEQFSVAVSYITGFSKLVTISATEKTLLPPPGLNKYKKQVKTEIEKKYGKDWENNLVAITEYGNRLKEYDDEYLKDDPTFNKFVSGKVKNIARPKLHLTFGAEFGFDKTGSKPKMVDQSLLEGYPVDKEKLATIYNTARAGYYDRGSETQKGGVVAKETLRSTAASKIIKKFCKTTKQSTIEINNNNLTLIKNRYINVNGKQVLVDDPKEYLNKTVKLYTPLYCKSEGSNFCYICAGESIKEYENGISLLVAGIAGTILNLSMKSMHGVVLSTVDIDIDDMLV